MREKDENAPQKNFLQAPISVYMAVLCDYELDHHVTMLSSLNLYCGNDAGVSGRWQRMLWEIYESVRPKTTFLLQQQAGLILPSRHLGLAVSTIRRRYGRFSLNDKMSGTSLSSEFRPQTAGTVRVSAATTIGTSS